MSIIWRRYLILMFILLFAQIFILPYLEILYTFPDLLICLVVYISFRIKPRQAILASAVSGLLKDFASSQIFGIFFLIFTAISWLVIFLRFQFVSDALIFQIFMVFFAGLFSNFVEFTYILVKYRNLLLWQQYFISAVYTGIISLIMFPIFYKVKFLNEPTRS